MEVARTSQDRSQAADAAKGGVSQEIKTHFRVCRFIIETGNVDKVFKLCRSCKFSIFLYESYIITALPEYRLRFAYQCNTKNSIAYLMLITNHIVPTHSTGVKLGMRSMPVSTACALYHKFFKTASLEVYEPYLVAMSSIYLAGKVEEQHLRTRDIINVCHR